MNDIKYCTVCNKEIANINTANYYSFIRIKYCPECKIKVTQNQNLKAVHEMRKRKKLINKERDTQIDLLKQENELLRKRIIALKEQII